MPQNNIDLLLNKLDKKSLAYDLVNMLKETPKDDWRQVLEQKLTEVFQKKKKEMIDAQNH